MNSMPKTPTVQELNIRGDYHYPMAVGDRVFRLYDGKCGVVKTQNENARHCTSIRTVVTWDDGSEEVFHFGLAAYGPPRIRKIAT
jgi:hypothetical protein